MTIAIRTAVAIALAVLPGTTFGQSGSNHSVKPLTVCELLRDLRRYSGKTVAVLGRLDCGTDLIDNRCFLTEDRCEPPIASAGDGLPDKVAIGRLPNPTPAFPDLERAVLFDKLSSVRKTTKLGLHKELRFKMAGDTLKSSYFVLVRDEWAVAYGRVVTPGMLKSPFCKDAPCHLIYGAPAVLMIRTDIHPLKDKDYPKPTPEQ